MRWTTAAATASLIATIHTNLPPLLPILDSLTQWPSLLTAGLSEGMRKRVTQIGSLSFCLFLFFWQGKLQVECIAILAVNSFFLIIVIVSIFLAHGCWCNFYFFRFYWDIIDIYHCMNFKAYTLTYIYCGMITTVSNIHHLIQMQFFFNGKFFFLVMRTQDLLS